MFLLNQSYSIASRSSTMLFYSLTLSSTSLFSMENLSPNGENRATKIRKVTKISGSSWRLPRLMPRYKPNLPYPTPY